MRLLSVCFFLLCSLSLSAEPGLRLGERFTETEVKAPFLHRLVNAPGAVYHPSQLPSAPDSWKAVDKINYGRNPHGWARFTVSSGQERTVWLELTSHFIDSVEVWAATPGTDPRKIRGPAHYRQQASALSPVTHRYYLYSLTLPQNEPLTVWVRGQVIPGDVLKFGVWLWAPEAFLDAWQKDTWGWALFTGIILTILGGVLVSWLLNPRKVYIYYAGYIFCMCIYMLLNDGWGVYLPGWLSGADKLSSISMAMNMAFCFFVLFSRLFLECSPLKYRPEIVLLSVNTLMIFILEHIAEDADPAWVSGLFSAGEAGLVCYGIIWGIYVADARRRRFSMLPLLLLAVGVMVTFLLLNHFLENSGIILNPLPDMLVMRGALLIELLILSTAWLRHGQRLRRNRIALAEQNRQLQSGIIRIQNNERERIARDLHDDLGGTLSTIKGQAANENASQETLSLIEKAIEDLRNVSRNLMPPELQKAGLAGSVHQAIERLRNSSKTEFIFISFGREVRLEADTELNIYRIIGELLNNILKHAGASKGVVQLIYYDDHMLISVEDNGVGIKTEEKNWGIGLKNINSRVEYLKAELSIDTGPYGTTVIIKVPY